MVDGTTPLAVVRMWMRTGRAVAARAAFARTVPSQSIRRHSSGMLDRRPALDERPSRSSADRCVDACLRQHRDDGRGGALGDGRCGPALQTLLQRQMLADERAPLDRLAGIAVAGFGHAAQPMTNSASPASYSRNQPQSSLTG